MKKIDNRSLQDRANDLQKALVFSIVQNVIKYYDGKESLDSFKKTYSRIVDGSCTLAEQAKFCGLFKHNQDQYRKILGVMNINGKRVRVSLEDVKNLLPNWLLRRENFSKHYKSGKSFHVHSYWYIDFDKLQEFIQNPSITDLNSDYYTKQQHKLIDNAMLNYKKKEVKTSNQDTQSNNDIVETSDRANKIIEAFHKMKLNEYNNGLIPFDCLNLVEVSFGLKKTLRFDNGWTPEYIGHKKKLVILTTQQIRAIQNEMRK